MKRFSTLILFIFSINAQESDNILNKNGYDDFDSPKFENKRIDSSVPKPPAILQSIIANSNPEFVSAASDSVYEDSTYLFNILTNDPDPDDIAVSVTSNPSWLTLTTKQGGEMNNITKYPYIANKLAKDTPIDYVTDIEFDSDGNLHYVDLWLYAIRKIGSDGKVTDFAGTHIRSAYHLDPEDGKAADGVQLAGPTDIAFDSNGNMYIADFYSHKIRKVDTNGIITTVAGKTGSFGSDGEGGAATSAELYYP